MKLHSHLLHRIIEALDIIFQENKYADKVIEKLFKANRKWGSRDRRFIAETIYEIVRFYRYYSEVVKSDDPALILAAYLIHKNHDLSGLKELGSFDENKIKDRLQQKYPEIIMQSFPDWMQELGEKEFGRGPDGEFVWTHLMRALNKPSEVYLRVNELKITKEKLVQELLKEDIQAEDVASVDSAIKLKERKNVFTTEAFKKGYFEVQDAASQFIAPLLAPQPGDRVVDACAGAGGKSLHLAAMMKNKGKIISMDIHEWKLGELKKRASRAGVDIIETKVIESTKVIKRLEGSFDKVLLDVPCSGLGVVRRNPDTKWKLTLEEIKRLQVLQQEIIQSYSKLAKSKGTLVYATCSILNSENEEQIQKFLSSEAGANWELKKEIRLWPHKDHFDGFYAALLEKNK